ncbi:hypothetical protein WJH17_005173 [Klebsiella pneumoniae]|nr:hypothetical protein [Klebsiella pneumoniae]EKV4755231.1 hypothetical protein [Escherichia coli]EKV5373603.1 hypothetical protein [Escherichia coli]EKV5582676.1 hypothetical protein [Escherichia coli]EKV9695823.1 hypothetical protein [Escherichia coli]MDI2663358.1 hypothetical protein [Klebsiella pneumoniae]
MKKFFDTDPDHYSKYALRRFSAAINAIGLVAFGVITYGICMMIEWWTA